MPDFCQKLFFLNTFACSVPTESWVGKEGWCVFLEVYIECHKYDTHCTVRLLVKKSIGNHCILSRCLGFRGYALKNYGISKLRKSWQNFIILHTPSTSRVVNTGLSKFKKYSVMRCIKMQKNRDTKFWRQEQKRQRDVFWVCTWNKLPVPFSLYHLWSKKESKIGTIWPGWGSGKMNATVCQEEAFCFQRNILCQRSFWRIW